MAKWNLVTAYRIFHKIKKSQPAILKRLVQKIGLSSRETAQWKRIASHICIKMDKENIIEQFDGYFKKRRVRISDWDENYMPIVTERISPRDYDKTQLVKQADVVMLIRLLSDVFNFKTKKKNYEYYVDRTIHKSSLSLSVYSLVAVDAGDKNRAYRFFNIALRTDISNIHSNTSEGVHAACMGGLWQALINGFAGVKIQKEILSINPKLPSSWRKVLFTLQWRGSMLKLEIKNDKIKIKFILPPGKKERIKIRVFGVLYVLSGNKVFTFTRKRHQGEQQVCYL